VKGEPVGVSNFDISYGRLLGWLNILPDHGTGDRDRAQLAGTPQQDRCKNRSQSSQGCYLPATAHHSSQSTFYVFMRESQLAVRPMNRNRMA
jgi:hypothetical protein